MKMKYKLQGVARGFLIPLIEDASVRFTPRILSCKLLHKMRPTECTTGPVEITRQCAQGLNFNWSQLLLNELIDDAEQAQEDLKYKFHYSCLLILISFTLWANPIDYVQMDVPLPCHGAKYQNLWEDKKKLAIRIVTLSSFCMSRCWTML